MSYILVGFSSIDLLIRVNSSETLNVYKTFICCTIQKALENAGIVASDTVKYPLNDVMAAVEFAFGGTPKIMCGKKGIIKELYLCFDKKFKVYVFFFFLLIDKFN